MRVRCKVTQDKCGMSDNEYVSLLKRSEAV